MLWTEVEKLNWMFGIALNRTDDFFQPNLQLCFIISPRGSVRRYLTFRDEFIVTKYSIVNFFWSNLFYFCIFHIFHIVRFWFLEIILIYFVKEILISVKFVELFCAFKTALSVTFSIDDKTTISLKINL